MADETRRMTEPPRGSAQVQPAQVPGVGGLLGLAVGVVVIAGLYLGKDVLIPITLAVLLSFVLSPIVEALRKLKLPRGAAVLLSVVVALGLVGGVGTVVGMQAASLVDDAPAYARTIENKIDQAQRFAAERARAFMPGRQAATPAATAGPESRIQQRLEAGTRQPIPVRVTEKEETPLALAGQALGPVLAPFETFVIVLVVAIFILMQKDDLRDRLIRVFGSSDLHRTTAAMDDAGRRLSRYFLSQLAVNASFGLVVSLGLWALGMPVPALWGILAGILRFVPYIGALLGAALPLVVAAGIEPGWSMAIWVAAIFAICEPVIGYVVEPLLYGHSTGLSPLSVVVAAVFWTWIWGPVGLVLSMPLTLCFVVLGRHIPALEFVDVLLGDRPALSPVASFYQRMLADDPEEAIEQAEVLLEERSLIAYYDEVALGGLKLAAEDARRGAIDREQAASLVAAMLEVIHDLDEHDGLRPTASVPPRPLNPMPAGNAEAPRIAETAPPALPDAPAGWDAPGSVLCVAGRGVLDDAVTAMLEQLLQHRGFGVRRVEHAAVGREALGRLDTAGTKLVCLSYLQVGGTPTRLRALTRRLGEATGGVPMVVGLWPAGELAAADAAGPATDAHVATLGTAVEAVLAIAHDDQEKWRARNDSNVRPSDS